LRSTAGFIGTRWLGVGLASILSVVTLGLALTGRLGLYINPDSSWFAVSMAIVVLLGAALSFTLPLGAEADHGHDHGAGHGPARGGTHSHARGGTHGPARGGTHSHARGGTHAHAAGYTETAAAAPEGRRMARTSEDSEKILRLEADPPTIGGHRTHPMAFAATVAGGVAASGVVLLSLVLPPSSLSAELAMSRDVGAPPLFAGADAVTLAATGDTSSFGVGEWAAVFATATNPDAFDGDTVTLTGFVTPSDGGAFDLTRLVITHCVIDAQPASIPVAASVPALETGQWVTITGTVSSTADGRLEIDATSVEPIAEPEDPYEY
jgi:uncharacterized repeat protein (TIGR03943 family)